MTEGEAVAVELLKPAKTPKRGADDDTGVSRPLSLNPIRLPVLASLLAGQRRMACARVSADSMQLGQVVGPWLS